MLLPWPAWGRTDMIRPCRCYGVPDLLQVPSPSSCGWVLTAKGSADTGLGSTLRFARCSSSLGPWSEAPLIPGLDCFSRWWTQSTYHNTVTNTYGDAAVLIRVTTHHKFHMDGNESFEFPRISFISCGDFFETPDHDHIGRNMLWKFVKWLSFS
jgi:hypothetical protein